MEPFKIPPKEPELLPLRQKVLQLRINRLKQMDAIKWVISRLKEGSSWAGVGIVAAAIGVPAELVEPGVQIVVAVAGFLAVIFKDKPEG